MLMPQSLCLNVNSFHAKAHLASPASAQAHVFEGVTGRGPRTRRTP